MNIHLKTKHLIALVLGLAGLQGCTFKAVIEGSSANLSTITNPTPTPSATPSPLACTITPGGCDEIIDTTNLEGCYKWWPYNDCTGGNCSLRDPKCIWLRNRQMAGTKVCIRAGTYSGLRLDGITGASGDPVTVTNCDGKVVIDTTQGTQQVGIMSTKTQYVRITGSGSGSEDPATKYGIEIKNSNPHGIDFDQGVSDIELDHLEVHDVYYLGIGVRNYPRCDGLQNRANFTQYNTLIHDNYVHDAQTGEGLYIGPSHYQLTTATGYVASCPAVYNPATGLTQVPVYLEPPLRGVKVYNNRVENTGRDGIQVGAAIEDMEIYNNVIKYYAKKQDSGDVGGIQINPGSVGKVYNNWIESFTGDAAGTAIQYEGGSTGPTEIYDNMIIHSKTPILTLGYLIGPTYPTIIRNNTAVNDGGVSLYLFCGSINLSNTVKHSMTIQDNILVGYGRVGSYIFTDTGGTVWTKIFDGFAARCPVNGVVYDNAPDANQKIPSNYYSTNAASAINLTNGKYTLLPGNSATTGKGANYIDPGI